MTEPLRALSVRQPWAHLILAGMPLMETVDNPDGSKRVELTKKVVMKDVENRSWRTHFRGRVMVHASRRDDQPAFKRLIDMGFSPMVSMALGSKKIPRGAILGEIEIWDCVPVAECDSPWATGPFCWLLREPLIYPKAIPCIGRQGFFEPKIEVTT